ncbi:E3 ubiquitin-protein ligase RING2 homolog spat-3 [Musca vetustissima]|uniref:E3 ubiquitin-protein ligase RING2 homolog spat-3 n=1 Tax=Musca vetustissima TaxID=27455 RepID=UPI002AB79B5C|nr:E3 ubiquitin-protein ligase RING2 homolog spat-3 [Musca vetustissima]
MKPFYLTLLFFALLAFALGEPPLSKKSLYFYSLPLKSAKQTSFVRAPGAKQKTLVVQIRSDEPSQLVLKGRPKLAHTHAHQIHGHHAHAHTHAPHAHIHHHINAAASSLHHHRAHPRPIKLTNPIYLKNPNLLRKPLKLKLNGAKLKPLNIHKPATSYDVPFKYEKPISFASSEVQHLPLEHHTDFIADHFDPIHTIPAPNLSLQDNHLHPEETYLPPATSSPKPQVYHQSQNNYQVVEENTNDQTIVDTFSGSQKYYAPDPDPSLPAAQIRPAVEPFNTPSNGKPLPADIQSNQLPVAQPLVQIVGAQASKHIVPEIYPVQFTQPLIAANVAAVQPAPIPIYNPTYLVTQSNNLYTQHQQQLFKPVEAAPVVEAGYVNADLTQEVASNGQILQAAKDLHSSNQAVLDVAPHFAALIAAPALDQEHQSLETAPFHLQNVAGPPSAITSTTESGFVVSNYYGNAHQDSSQLLQAYAEEEQAEAQRQQYEELQQQQQFQQHQLHQQQQLQQQQLDQQQQLQQYQQFQQQQQQFLQHNAQPLQQLDPAASAFEEHQRLVKQQLGADTPLRIFVPDEEARLQKRSDDISKNSVEYVDSVPASEDDHAQDDLFEVSQSSESAEDYTEKELLILRKVEVHNSGVMIQDFMFDCKNFCDL